MFKTELCNLLNIKKPIFQGGMAWVATGELAAAVSKAGGMGIIGSGNAPAKVVKEEIRKVKKATEKPFAVNIMLLSPFAEDIIQLVIEEKVPVITTGAGNPGKYMDRLKNNNIKVIPVVPSVALARRVERIGADAVIAEGNEAGGHIGNLTTMSLIPQISDALNIPVIAAGGIGDGRGLVAAISLGADGVQLGTRFVCAEECTAHDNYKNAIIKAKDRDAVVTGRTTGHPVRNLKNKLTRKIDKMEKKGVDSEEIEKIGTDRLRQAVREGNIEKGSVMAGQIAGMISEVQPAKTIIEEIIDQAEKIVQRNNNIFGVNNND
ncbi:MAG: enoyl-[acyl-carrier-protein] reductase FabK [Halanaerobiaceae bacterium]